MVAAAGMKYRSTFTHQFLAGITAGDWWRLLRANGFAFDLCYAHRVAFLTAMSLINARYRREEERCYGAAIAATELAAPPVFVLGHWRSGTTYLHNLLVRDAERFAFPSVYQATFPHTFLSTEALFSERVARFVPKTRMVDNVAFNLGLPQEDEFAMCVATGYSALLGMVFPRRVDQYDRYLTLREVPAAEVQHWKATLVWFLRKLTYKHGRAIVLKSPPHTARVRLLLELFPDARFIHICRDPYAVFQSTRHMYDTMVWHTYLQQPDVGRIEDNILQRYVTMYDAFFDEWALVPQGQRYELRFEDLRRDPVGEMQQLYAALGFENFAAVEPCLRTYVASLRAYRQNDYRGLDMRERERVATTWRRSFDAWGYAI